MGNNYVRNKNPAQSFEGFLTLCFAARRNGAAAATPVFSREKSVPTGELLHTKTENHMQETKNKILEILVHVGWLDTSTLMYPVSLFINGQYRDHLVGQLIS